MTRPVRPRALVHRGVVESVGVVVSEGASLDGGRRRVLSLWSPGATAFRVGGGWLLRWSSPRRLRAEEAPGDVLVARSVGAVSLLLTAPLDASELAQVIDAGARAGDVVRVRGAEAIAERVSATDAVDPSQWLDLGTVTRVEVRSLGAPIASLRIVSVETPRAVLKGVTGASAGAFAQALSGALDAMATGRADALAQGAGGAEASAAQPLAERLKARLMRAILTAARWFGAGRARSATQGEDGALPTSSAAPPPGAFARWMAKLDAWLAGAIQRSRIAEAFGARYAKYLTNMVDAFERGDLDEALKMAVPLGDGAPSSQAPSTSWTLPSPRAGLDIRVGAKPAGPGFGTSLYERIRALYRATAERLEAEGRVEEAAFVHAELLGDLAGAVSLLERHGRLVRAAELAEAAKLLPELVIRQWIVAGDLDRAALHARRTKSFQVAVTKLEGSDAALALPLRREWARCAAAAGDLALAVEIAWAKPELREMTAAWIEDAVALGGVGGARMLARKLTLRPERLAEVLAALSSQAEDRSHDGARARAAFAQGTLQAPMSPASQVASRAVARSIIADGARGALADARVVAVKLIEHAQDSALRTDIPVWPEATRLPLSAAASPRTFAVDVADVGTRALRDSASLPDGRVLLAMGEAGVWIVSREGRVVVRLDAPAHALVLSDHGDRCLALARRGRGFRVSHVDLARRTSRPWGEVELDAFATTYDGDGWVVATERDVAVVDALAPRVEVLRPAVRIEHGVKVVEIVRTPTQLAIRTAGERPEVWAWDTANSWILRVRHESMKEAGLVAATFDAAGTRLFPTRSGRWALALHDPAPRALAIDLGNATGPSALLGASMSPAWIAVASKALRGVEVTLFDRAKLALRWRATLAGATTVSMRFADERLTLCDDAGRALGLDLRFGDLAHDLRV